MKYLIFFFYPLQIICAQDTPGKYTLYNKSFDELILLYDANVKDSVLCKNISRIYINKARKENDSIKMARGYSRLSFVSSYEDAIKYLDTTITLSKNSSHPNFPTTGYLFKSLYEYKNESYEESLKDAILGYQFAKRKGNLNHQIMALHQINGINELWGDYSKTLEAEQITFNLLQNNKGIENYYSHYMSSLEGLGKCYVRLNKPDSALYYFKKGIITSLEMNDSITYYAFVSRTGSALYLKKKYRAAMDSLEKAQTKSEYFVDSYKTYYHYYKGLIYESTNEVQKAIAQYQKIDSLYEYEKILFPELPIIFNKMVEYFKEINNKEQEVKYLYKQLYIDSVIDTKQIFVKEKTNRDYTIPNLLEAKNKDIEGLQKINSKAKSKLWILFLLFILVFILGYYYFHRQRIYRKRYEKLMLQGGKREILEPIEKRSSLDISKEIVNELLKKLENFETNKEYLSKDISLNELAKTFGTNSSYLSKIINDGKQKNFSNYINDLRVSYAFEEIKTNPTFRKYTIKAIAEESGFKNAESFSKTFYKLYGFYPSFYIKKLKDGR